MNESQAFLNQDYRHADRFMLFLVWGLFVMALGLSGMHDTLKWAFIIGLPLAAIPTALILMLPGALLTRAVVAFALMAFTALHIHQAAGVTELHFGVFVLLAFLVCYRDWKVIVIAAGVIAVHHLLFNYLQEWGYGVLCFTQPGIGRVASHAAYVVGESAVLCYLAVLLRQDALRSAELHWYIKELAENDHGIIDLAAHRSAAISDAGKILDDMVAKLRTSIASVQQGAESISIAAREIATGNDDLEAQARLQSQSLVDTASSMEQMTAAVRDNADNARRANELAVSASDVATRGGEVVSKVVATMGSINESSKKITDIIGVIDGIAFQTNILALNAAVEAARAGEQGRGFAVVASEVRNLAQRSAAAAKDIKNLISDSVQKADTGSKLVSEAGITMEEIVTEIRRVTDLMTQIVAVSHTQSDGIEQVDRARREMDEVAQQNAELVEQRANAARRLQEQAENLARAVSIFRLREAALESKHTTASGRPTLRIL